MPVAPTYPGVYIEEIPSGVRTITGVATSITAFIGRALRGPVNEAVTINSFGDFERIFGGLWVGSSMGYAVRDFYLNGGSQAIIIRLYHAEQGKPSKSKLAFGGVKLEAAYEGSWGQYLRGSTDKDVSGPLALSMGLTKDDLFNLTVFEEKPGGRSEVFRNVSVKESSRRIDKVLKSQSSLVRWDGTLDPANLPTITETKDDVLKAEKDVADGQTALDKANKGTDQNAKDAAIKALNDAKATLKTTTDALIASDGVALTLADDFTPNNGETDKKGLYALEQADLFNILCLPPYLSSGDIDQGLTSAAAAYCEKRRSMLLVDPPSGWISKDEAKKGIKAGVGTTSKNSALYFPRLRQPNLLRDNQFEDFVPCGAVAGTFARTDTQRGVWKAPAGLDAVLNNVPALSVDLTDPENGELNPLGVNCLRTMVPAGRVIWGARTLQGDDRLASEWKYVPVRRTALYIEESLYRGTQWVVFEPNDEPLWAQIRLNVGAFMHNLFRQGAFQGTTPKDAYFVKCDKETTTQNDINLGIVNIVVGFAPLKPAEFVIIKLQQMAGQIET